MRILKILACALTIVSNAHAEIISSKSMDDIQQIIEKNEEKDLLVVFDVDMTITQPNHPAAFYPSLIKYKEIYKEIVDTLTAEQKDLMSTLILDQPQILVEENTPNVIANLQKKYKTIAFTAVLATQEIVDRRIKTLNDLDVKFTQGIENMTFSDIKSHHGQRPLFTQGILFGNGEVHSKGIIFCAFLKRLQSLPKIVIVVDDRKKNLEDIQKTLLEHKIDVRFLGIEYKGAFTRNGNITKEEFKDFWMNLADQVKKQTRSGSSK